MRRSRTRRSSAGGSTTTACRRAGSRRCRFPASWRRGGSAGAAFRRAIRTVTGPVRGRCSATSAATSPRQRGAPGFRISRRRQATAASRTTGLRSPSPARAGSGSPTSSSSGRASSSGRVLPAQRIGDAHLRHGKRRLREPAIGLVFAGGLPFMSRWRAGYRYDRLDHGEVSNGIGLTASDAPLLLTEHNPTRNTAMIDWSLSEFSRVPATAAGQGACRDHRHPARPAVHFPRVSERTVRIAFSLVASRGRQRPRSPP